MKGFLQRVAAQAAPDPGKNALVVHPLVGSLSSGRHDLTPETLHEETLVTPVSNREAPSTLTSASPLESSLRPIVSQKGDEQEPYFERKRFQPLLDELSPQDAIRQVQPASGLTSRESPHQDRPSRLESESLETTVREKIVVKEDSAAKDKPISRVSFLHETLLGESPIRQATLEDTGARLAKDARRVIRAAPLASDSRADDVNEIQINIGRIELTAVPQVTSRPASPPRKSLNLDEYLKRRNGRNA